jgi:hypothetical protein
MQRRLCRIVACCGCHERVVEDVYRTTATLSSLDSSEGPSCSGGHNDVPELGLDTPTDILSQLEDVPNPTQLL